MLPYFQCEIDGIKSNFGTHMKAIGIFTIYMLCLSSAYSQLAEPLFFKEKTHDFGEILEQQGNADYEFVFTNNSGRPVRIISVQASCGCTTPDWSKDAVVPGKSGFIKASYDPKGRPGYFNKSLTVNTDLSGNPVVLQIKGTVVDKIIVKDETLSAVNGNLRLKNTSFSLGKIFNNKEISTKEFAIANEGKKKIDFIEVIAPSYIQVIPPPTLQPGERGVIKLRYDAKATNQYGFQSDNIELKTTDSLNANKSFSVYATIEEFFPVLKPEELAKAPVLMADKYEIDFLRVNKDQYVEKTVILQNRGKRNLELRYIQTNCSCVVASLDKQVLKPGETASLLVKFITEGRGGTQNKAITVYSNDPRNPVQRITITGYIED